MIKNILYGWKNYLSKSDVSETTAKHRAALCSKCVQLRQGKLLAFVKDRLTEIEGAYCNVCKCPLSAKVRSNDICPENHW